MTEMYVPYCNNKAASEELLASHRTYLSVSRRRGYTPWGVGGLLNFVIIIVDNVHAVHAVYIGHNIVLNSLCSPVTRLCAVCLASFNDSLLIMLI